MKYVIKHMPSEGIIHGGTWERTPGYYYIQIKGTHWVLCEGGHPDWPIRFWDSDKDAKINAQTYIDKVLN